MTERVLDFLFNSNVTVWAWGIVPLIVLALSFRVLVRQPVVIRIVASLLFALSSLCLLFFTALSWGLRDGVAVIANEETVLVNGVWVPVDKRSHGAQALSLFMGGFVPTLLISGVIAGVALLLCYLPGFIEQRRKP